MRVIYEPEGKAREYCGLAANLYRGCKHIVVADVPEPEAKVSLKSEGFFLKLLPSFA